MRPIIHAIQPALCDRIIDEARHILATTGMEIRGELLRHRLLDSGLQQNADGTRLLFPPAAIDRALATAPACFTLFDRAGNPYVEIGGEQVRFTPGSSGLRILDHRTHAVRPAQTADFVEYVRLCEGLAHIDYPATAFSTADVEPQVSDAWRLYLCLTNTEKPIVSGAFSAEGVPRMGEMMALFRRDRDDLRARPMSIFTITATGNFRYSEDSCQNLLDCAEWGIPMEIVPVTLMGLIAPVTQVGALVFHTVDTLAGVVMAQLVRPGTPVLFGGAPAEFHMREATAPMLGIQALRLDVAYAAIGKRLGLPTQAYMALSDARALDAQAGAETFGSALLAGLAGINSISGPGMLDYVMTFSLPKLVFDNEVCGQVKHFLKPIEPLDDLPAGDLVTVQMTMEHMLTAPHTLTHWPDQLYMPSPVWDRKSADNRVKAGSPTLLARATAEVEERLAAYRPLATDPAVDAALRRLITSGMITEAPLPHVPAADARQTARRSSQRRTRRARHDAESAA